MRQFIDLFLHLDLHLNAWAGELGVWLYALLVLIIFVETGLVIMPFLPGDSLLFAVGALSATPGSPIDLVLTGGLLTVAAIAGDACNYVLGRYIGPKVFRSETTRLLDKGHLLRAQAFYEKHGGKTIILARFMPIIRTFAPFVAGIGNMSYARFAAYNVIGALLWIWSFLLLGFWFGNQPTVKKNFTFVIFAILAISTVPAVVEFVRARRAARSRR